MSKLPTRNEAGRGWDEVLGSLHGAPFGGQDIVHAVMSAYVDGRLTDKGNINYEAAAKVICEDRDLPDYIGKVITPLTRATARRAVSAALGIGDKDE